MGKYGKFGNYSGYYGYRRDSDERMQGFQPVWFKGLKCIDIGCNSGEFTISVAKKFQPKHILGVDIDAKLIVQAHEHLAKRKEELGSGQGRLIPRSLAVKNQSKSSTCFPKNVDFLVVDITNDGDNVLSTYDTILCMSVAKWIHLHKGDEGLLAFFRKLHELLEPNGRVILEYQPWKSYVNNKRASAITMKNFKEIQVRPEDFEVALCDIGFQVLQRLGSTLEEAQGFSRPILVLGKKIQVLDKGEASRDRRRKKKKRKHHLEECDSSQEKGNEQEELRQHDDREEFEDLKKEKRKDRKKRKRLEAEVGVEANEGDAEEECNDSVEAGDHSEEMAEQEVKDKKQKKNY
jgi:7SK snRNA methylphosphate capping enzyme